MFNETQIKALEAKLDPKHVTQRTQSGRTLDYIEGWQAIAEANRIFGFAAWDRETVELVEVRRDQVNDKYGKPQWRIGYMAKVRVSVRGDDIAGRVTREGTGFGSGAMADLGEAIESAIKEAETDAMKRALMTFGNPFGLALYDKTKANVGHDQSPAPVNDTRSSASLKRDGEWEKVRDEIASDLTDCHTHKAIDDCMTIWRDKFIEMKWPKAWSNAAKDLFEDARATIKDIEYLQAGE